MNNLTNRISGLAMLALAALPIASLPASALAAPAVRVADINLSSPEGMSTFDARANAAARDFCRSERSVSAAAACRSGVKQELSEKAATLRSAQVEQATKTFAAR